MPGQLRPGVDSAIVASAIFLLILSCGAIAAGWGSLRTARRMRSFQTTRGTVVKRELATVSPGTVEGRWGKGGGYRPQVTYAYTVDGVDYSSDRMSHSHRGLKHSLAEQELAAIPDEVQVYYDPAAPQEAYLQTHGSKLGSVLVAGGAVGALVALVALLAG